MATMSKDRVTVKTTKNQLRFDCQKLVLKDKGKADPFMLGKFRVDAQFTIKKLTSIDPKLEKKCHEEALKVIGKASAAIEDGLDQLRKTTAAQQKKEQQGDKNARKAADAELKKLNKIIDDCKNGIGADIRKALEALLKKEGVDSKVMSVARNILTPVCFENDAFSEAPEDEGLDDKSTKAWGKLGKGELAITDKHPAILQEVKLRTSLAKSVAPFVAARGGDVGAARKELQAYITHGESLGKLLYQSAESIAAMAKQLKKDKRSVDPKLAKRLFKELDGLDGCAGTIYGMVEDGVGLANDLSDLLKTEEDAKNAAQYKNEFAAFVKGVATIKTEAKKSSSRAKIVDALSKSLTAKK